jgi:hypothetical protein
MSKGYHLEDRIPPEVKRMIKARAALEGKAIPQVVADACIAYCQKPITLTPPVISVLTFKAIGKRPKHEV